MYIFSQSHLNLLMKTFNSKNQGTSQKMTRFPSNSLIKQCTWPKKNSIIISEEQLKKNQNHGQT